MWTELKSILNERIVNWTRSWEKGTTLALLVNFFKSTNCVAKGKLLSQMAMKFFFAKARRVIIQLSPNFFWNFSYPYTHIFNTDPIFFDHYLNFPARAIVHPLHYIQINDEVQSIMLNLYIWFVLNNYIMQHSRLKPQNVQFREAQSS